MDETPEIEAKRDRPLLRALLRTEILITLPTLVISIALAYFSFVEADASRKMQRTETWPYVSYGTDNSSPQVKDEISFNLSNDGVGPARLEEMEFLYNGKPMRDPADFIRNCCAATVRTVGKSLTYTTESVDGVLRPGEKRGFMRLAKTQENAALWNQLNDERWKVVVRLLLLNLRRLLGVRQRQGTAGRGEELSRRLDEVRGIAERSAGGRCNRQGQGIARSVRPFWLPLFHGPRRRSDPDDGPVPAP